MQGRGWSPGEIMGTGHESPGEDNGHEGAQEPRKRDQYFRAEDHGWREREHMQRPWQRLEVLRGLKGGL